MDLADRRFWDHVEGLSEGGSKCKFCGHPFAANTSISRIKWHLSGEKGHGVKICNGDVPQDVREAAFLASGNANKRRKTVADSSNINKDTDPAPTFPQQNNENANIPTDAGRSTEPAAPSFPLEISNPTEAGTEDMMADYINAPDFDRFGISIGENRDFSCAQAGNHIENMTIEMQQPIQTSIHSERFLIHDRETTGAAIQPTDEVSLILERTFCEIDACLTIETRLPSQTSTTPENHPVDEPETMGAAIPQADELSHNLVEDGAVDVETQQEHQPMEVEMQQEQPLQPTDEGQNNLVENGAAQEFQPMEVQEHQPLLDLFCEMDINAKAALWPLFEKLVSPDLLEFARKEQVDSELEKWKRKLFKIHADLDVAEVKQVTNLDVKYWLSNLRDLAYDAEEILDWFQTEAARCRLKRAESQGSTSAATQGLPTSCADPQSSSISRHMVTQSKLENITTRLEELVKEKNDLCLPTNVGRRSTRASDRVPTTSLAEPNVYGKEKVKEELVELLLSGDASNSRHSVIPIVGMGGMGKTTLAQVAYNDMRLKFDHKAWVCVSDEFDITKMTKTILLHVGGDPEVNDLNVLQQRLKDKLYEKKFFIVLDDIWEHKYDDWTTLCRPFAAGASGSKILITTRDKDVSSMIGTTRPFELKELSYDESLCLFSQHAMDAENFDAHQTLKEVGEAIVKRCKGLPLAAKTLGGLLRHNQQLQKWEEILNSEIWHLSEEKSDILPALRLSYHHLPSHLKQCFAYCAIFPKDYEFDKDDLVMLWMAQGFLQQLDRRQPDKDLGSKYFDDLLSRCLFQESSSNKSRYVMHDLLNDLAQFVSGEACFQLDDRKGSKSLTKVRHTAFVPRMCDTWQRFDVLDEMKSLRTFIALPSSSAPFFLSSKALDDLVPKLKCLRSLSLAACCSLRKLPNSIDALKHLRYLNLSFTSIATLPESLGELLNLQTLKLCDCRELVGLPPCIGNLINLECLDVSGTESLREMSREISKLKNLVTLPKFIVREGNGLGIGELKKLPNLRGQLCIYGLHNTANIHETKFANLKEKQGLDELSLTWCDPGRRLRILSNKYQVQNESHKYQVLNSLQPHQSLRKLSITCYFGTMFPPWVGDPIFTKLVDIQLSNCHRITSLPSLGKLPALRILRLVGMHEVKEVDAEGFPSLEILMIEDMMRWEQWSWSNGLNEKFPKLHTFTLEHCPELIGNWPICLPSLRKLEIRGCRRLADFPKALPSLCELKVDGIPPEVISKSVHHFTSLTELRIKRILGLASFPEVFVQALDALEDLVVQNCYQLKCLWEDGFALGKLANLKRLVLLECAGLVSLVEGEDGLLPCNLQVLEIKQCDHLKKLPNGLSSLTSLRELRIHRCPRLVSFPEGAGLPCSLKSLQIVDCDSLESLPHWTTTTTMNGNKNQQCLLKNIEIVNCPSLKYFSRGRGERLPSTLKQSTISGRDKLVFREANFQVDDAHEDVSPHYPHMKFLRVQYLSLASFPTGYEFPTSLQTLKIVDCKMPKSLPSSSLHSLSHLTDLEIPRCDELELFPEGGLPLPNLTHFRIMHCDKLRCLPNQMENLTSLQDLTICSCNSIQSFPESGFPLSLIQLHISGCEKLTQQPLSREWGLHALTSLKSLSINFHPSGGVDFCFPDEDGLLLPTSLTNLAIISHENVKSISRGIQNLTSLKQLFIWKCPNLKSLPKKGFAPTLGCLDIHECPLLAERCSEKKGGYWPIIAHIPRVDID